MSGAAVIWVIGAVDPICEQRTCKCPNSTPDGFEKSRMRMLIPRAVQRKDDSERNSHSDVYVSIRHGAFLHQITVPYAGAPQTILNDLWSASQFTRRTPLAETKARLVFRILGRTRIVTIAVLVPDLAVAIMDYDLPAIPDCPVAGYIDSVLLCGVQGSGFVGTFTLYCPVVTAAHYVIVLSMWFPPARGFESRLRRPPRWLQSQ